MRIRINVTEKDISKGQGGNDEKCPIARALRKAGFKSATVSGSEVTVYSRRNPLTASAKTGKPAPVEELSFTALPKKVRAFVNQFDSGATKPKPFSFTLNVSLADLKRLNFKPRKAA